MNKALFLVTLLALAAPAGIVLAQDAAAPPADDSSQDRKPSLDVFRVLIKPEAPPPQIIQPSSVAAPAPPPPPPPISFSVKAIAGEAPHYVAVITYNNNDYIVEEGWESEDHAFTVKRIGPSKTGVFQVEVFNKKTNRLQYKEYKEQKIPGYEGEGGTGAGTDAAGGGADLGLGGGGDAAGGGTDAGGGGGLDGGALPPDAGGGMPPDAGGGTGGLDGGAPPPDAGGGGDGGGLPPQ